MMNSRSAKTTFQSEGERRVMIKSFRNARALNVIINTDNPNCGESVEIIDRECAKYGIEVNYLLVNHSKFPLPQWCLREGFSVINFKSDFAKDGTLLTDRFDDFFNEEVDFLFVLSNRHSKYIEKFAALSKAHFKLGREHKRTNPYDLSIKYHFSDIDSNLASDIFAELAIITNDNNA